VRVGVLFVRAIVKGFSFAMVMMVMVMVVMSFRDGTYHNRAKVATQPPDVRRLTTWGTLKSACQLNTTLRLNTTLWLTIETLWLNTTLWCNAT